MIDPIEGTAVIMRIIASHESLSNLSIGSITVSDVLYADLGNDVVNSAWPLNTVAQVLWHVLF